ncbi:[NiFe]-hydrogenase assembly, chaperone, HybE [Vreelandella andesensis]|uniref:[NiFe]-hydrogenase assembly, chaperone, HybE n=1 Tax=Vreelandella andesensis TaxID=447567 RepID=A0A3S0Y0W9_9GAMM|nr:[NiFe]-hydrogenase assembly chaperone HybE [Halomonas andesensis]RUR27290.1 [NiFe]-hydrogenase assembly, chaperone, HybE [Halomonas andesensis]
MRTLTAQEYERLAELASHYRDTHLRSMKLADHYNPRLGVDALCFQPWQGKYASLLVGALITPCAMWLVAVPSNIEHEPMGKTLYLCFPSGHYSLSCEQLPNGSKLYKRVVLESLSDLESMQEAARLAQRMMMQLMVSDKSSPEVD